MALELEPLSKDQARASYGAYESSNKTLRAWLATYSVGVPAYLFTKSGVVTKLDARHVTGAVALFFAIAIALQVALTLFNKYTQWAIYARHTEPRQLGIVTEWCSRVSEWILVDFLMDLATVALLAWGSIDAFRALIGH